jgi:triacylglycerol lipase
MSRRPVPAAATLLLALAVALLAASGLPAAALVGLPTPARGGDPAFSVPERDLAAALQCSDLTDAVGHDADPILLVHGTMTWGYEQYHWTWEPALDALGLDWCTVTYPHRGLGDMQVSAEYVAYAVKRMHAITGRRVDVVGHSQGGAIPRWAIKFWPSVQRAVDDFVGIAATHHGTTLASGAASQRLVPMPPAIFQFDPASNFVRTINAGDETPGRVSYTQFWSEFDEEVQPSRGPDASQALDYGREDRNTVNLTMEELCPGRITDHNMIGLFDRVAFAVTLRAFADRGPLDVAAARASNICAVPSTSPWAPFAAVPMFPDPILGPASVTNGLEVLLAEPQHGLPSPPLVTSEPPIRPYAR